MNKIILIGYSGHAFVVADILLQQKCAIIGYMENSVKDFNPFNLTYLGSEKEEAAQKLLTATSYVVAIGDNTLRRRIYKSLEEQSNDPFNAVHPGSTISSMANIGNGVTIMAGVCINPLAWVGDGAIINTGAIIEHECRIEEFAHIAPSATLAGNVTIGKNSFIGANSTIKEGIIIGENVVVGAGSVIVKNIPDNFVVYGNPGRLKR